jgi:hypothetical protein
VPAINRLAEGVDAHTCIRKGSPSQIIVNRGRICRSIAESHDAEVCDHISDVVYVNHMDGHETSGFARGFGCIAIDIDQDVALRVVIRAHADAIVEAHNSHVFD